MIFDPEKYHRQSLRLKNHDYSRDGYYFVTICARNRENIFADFCVGAALAPAYNQEGRPREVPLHPKIPPALVLTATGRIVENNWRKIAYQNVKTDTFVIMPNHIHGIIIIKSDSRVGARLALAPDLSPAPDFMSAPTLGAIIGAFKSRCALEYLKFIDANDLNETGKIWQRNYYEHIIRNRKELAAIRNYIRTNPVKWHNDEENPLNLKKE